LNTSPEAVEAFKYRTETSGDTNDRFIAPFRQLNEVLSDAPFFGLGIGVTHTAAFTIMGTTDPWWLGDPRIVEEEEIARMAEEIGIVGVLLLYLARFLIVALALRCTSSFKDPAYRALGIVLTIQLTLGLWLPMVTNPTAGLYYWGSLGLMLSMMRLERLAYTETRTMVAPGRRKLLPSVAHTG